MDDHLKNIAMITRTIYTMLIRLNVNSFDPTLQLSNLFSLCSERKTETKPKSKSVGTYQLLWHYAQS